MIQSTYRDLVNQGQRQTAQWDESQGASLDLGKKISVPRDVMMEELQLKTNRGSCMFHERLKRVEKFTLENGARLSKSGTQSTQAGEPGQPGEAGEAGEQASRAPGANGPQEGKENSQTEKHISGPAGKTSLLASLQQTMSKKGSPGELAPGYSEPLKEVPHERFNFTVIPKSYHCPWIYKPSEPIPANLNAPLPGAPQKVKNYKSFNRAPTPFGGGVRTPRYEVIEFDDEPSPAWSRMCHRPDFNRAPQGWGESEEL